MPRNPIPAVAKPSGSARVRSTADRPPAVADLALANAVHLLRKPVKPAALRAAMAHVASRRLAAE